MNSPGRGKLEGKVAEVGKIVRVERRVRGGSLAGGGSLAVERGGDDSGGRGSWRRGWRHGGPEAAAA